MPTLESIGLVDLAPILSSFADGDVPRESLGAGSSRALGEACKEGGKRVFVAWLVSKIDACDPISRGHSWRVSRLVHRFCETAGLRARACAELTEGALLHDVGKIAMPKGLLRRPGPLSSDEYGVVQRHAEVGGRILAQIPTLAHAAPIARWHHERWDGRGYPGSLRATQVPFGARLVSVLDALDAMTSRRAYSEPVELPEALAELRAHAGTQFDPEIVRAACAIEWRPMFDKFERNCAGDLCNA